MQTQNSVGERRAQSTSGRSYLTTIVFKTPAFLEVFRANHTSRKLSHSPSVGHSFAAAASDKPCVRRYYFLLGVGRSICLPLVGHGGRTLEERPADF
jgi:hypothetical protein